MVGFAFLNVLFILFYYLIRREERQLRPGPLHWAALPENYLLPLFDQEERVCVQTVEDWADKLGCDLTSQCKVVSILGNTGEGKSHTLNHTFFAGAPVFSTSSLQESCTTGAWASYDPDLQVVIIDTEGMLGAAENENMRTRLLLKVLAVSDIVIYR